MMCSGRDTVSMVSVTAFNVVELGDDIDFT